MFRILFCGPILEDAFLIPWFSILGNGLQAIKYSFSRNNINSINPNRYEKYSPPIHDPPTLPITITGRFSLLATFQSTVGCVNRTRHHPSLNHTRSNRDWLAIQHGSRSHRSTISSDKSQHRRTILNKKFGMVARVRWFEYLCGRGGGSIFPPDFTRCRTISKRSIPPNTTQWSTTRVHR